MRSSEVQNGVNMPDADKVKYYSLSNYDRLREEITAVLETIK